jgi:hypothetical protein
MSKITVGSAVAALILSFASAALANDNDSCWQDGYRKGVCDARGQTYCVPPVAPVTPVPPVGRDDCQSRFADGYREGLSRGR